METPFFYLPNRYSHHDSDYKTGLILAFGMSELRKFQPNSFDQAQSWQNFSLWSNDAQPFPMMNPFITCFPFPILILSGKKMIGKPTITAAT